MPTSHLLPSTDKPQPGTYIPVDVLNPELVGIYRKDFDDRHADLRNRVITLRDMATDMLAFLDKLDARENDYEFHATNDAATRVAGRMWSYTTTSTIFASTMGFLGDMSPRLAARLTAPPSKGFSIMAQYNLLNFDWDSQPSTSNRFGNHEYIWYNRTDVDGEDGAVTSIHTIIRAGVPGYSAADFDADLMLSLIHI